MAQTGTDQDATRSRLVEMAQGMIEERGAVGLSLSELAARAGISQGHLSRYFDSREELMEAIADHWFKPMADIMEDVLASDLPPRRKMYEFFARRFVVMRKKWEADPVKLQTYIEVGNENFEQVRSYIDLADHYLGEIIGEAMSDGHFTGLDVDETISLINQMCAPYCALNTMTMFMERLNEDKLARIIDAVFDGLSAQDRGARAVTGLRAA
ncbi:TetR family transcriptional regulator [Novosphingobium taihuense]|uniref:AcrR family transcriptional regulator n=1 Tax=Novosphingobium taihuense TaxID=260085 RepID=A0A7W7AAU0_9SPHN|nr:TetR family transcriptional regulator [Novosphingobium taihuense]MBB4612822.1 AcrR family transcriptional regulator [Novosphingobium taihuense]TWH80268.1 TetR family transcriptional regulator [Novosphingobium taihuense]